MTFNTLHSNYLEELCKLVGFKPCYKWMTFNTTSSYEIALQNNSLKSFKPCYKWMTFNTIQVGSTIKKANTYVLNLVING